MTEHQNRLFREMLQKLKEYPRQGLSFSQFVANLEGLLDAAEIKDKHLTDEWYKYWTPLEIANGYYADTGKEPPFSEIEAYLTRFIGFMEAVVEKTTSHTD
jgi:hypothetical protein